MKTKTILLAGWMVTLILLLIVLATPSSAILTAPYGGYVAPPLEPEIIYREAYITQAVYIPKEVYTRPHEFSSIREFRDYVADYRTNKMVQYGSNRCVAYAEDFMTQAISDSRLVSTETLFDGYETDMFEGHMVNTAIIGDEVWAVDISSGTVKIFGIAKGD